MSMTWFYMWKILNPQKAIELIDKFSKLTRYKSIHKNRYFYNSRWSKNKINKLVQFTKVAKRIKYLIINSEKEVIQNLYSKNHKILLENEEYLNK